MSSATTGLARGIRAARAGVLVNLGLAAGKGVAGIVGHSFALVADAVESLADILGSLVVWSGLRVAARAPDADHPWGHGKAEPLAAAIVGAMLVAAALGIAWHALRWALVPHEPPAAWTLAVLAGVVVTKEWLARRTARIARATGSAAVAADAGHHRADAISSGAAFAGIAATVVGGGGWAWADEAAALVAGGFVAANGWGILRPALHELMDGTPERAWLDQVSAVARGVPGVVATEPPMARKVGTRYFVDLHVHADPAMTLREAHALGGRVKATICRAMPEVANVLVHMEPAGPGGGA